MHFTLIPGNTWKLKCWRYPFFFFSPKVTHIKTEFVSFKHFACKKFFLKGNIEVKNRYLKCCRKVLVFSLFVCLPCYHCGLILSEANISKHLPFDGVMRAKWRRRHGDEVNTESDPRTFVRLMFFPKIERGKENVFATTDYTPPSCSTPKSKTAEWEAGVLEGWGGRSEGVAGACTGSCSCEPLL